MDNLKYKTECYHPIGVTEEANILNINYSNALQSYYGRSIILSEEMEKTQFRKFINLKNQWINETMFTSSGSDLISNSAYRDIISFGEIALPWIERELKRNDYHWFYALEKITGINPIKEENRGVIQKMKEDWLTWLNENDY